jgi:hypothetical protein
MEYPESLWGVLGMLMFVPVTVYDSPVVYSTWRIASTILVVDSVVALIVPLVKLGTTLSARAGEQNPSRNKPARICLI